MTLDAFGDLCPRCLSLLTIVQRRCASCGWDPSSPDVRRPARPDDAVHPTQHHVYSAADLDAILAELAACGTDPHALRRWAARREVRTALVRASRIVSSVRLTGRTAGGGWVEFSLVDGEWRRSH